MHQEREATRPYKLHCNYLERPLAIDDERPSLGWAILSLRSGYRQSSYRILAASSPELLSEGRADLWDSGEVESPEQVQVKYGGVPLGCGAVCHWAVRVRDEHGVASEWSEPSRWRSGLMGGGWTAQWLGLDSRSATAYDPSIPYYCADDFDKGENQLFLPPAVYLRKEFVVEREPVSAILYLSAFGLCDARLNGEKVGGDVLSPGWSDYSKTVYYRAYDASALVSRGPNAIGVVLADGWFSGYIGLNPRQRWGARPRAMAQLELRYEDGSVQKVASDSSWRASTGPILEADILHGERYDARLELDGWDRPGYGDRGWKVPDLGAEHDLLPVAHPGPSIAVRERLTPVETRAEGDVVFVDLGRCIAGFLEITVSGERGAVVSIRHAEEIDGEGRLYLRGNRAARAEESYVLSGAGSETYRPSFTYHGFRYAELRLSGAVRLHGAVGLSIGSMMDPLTEFECSSPVINTAYSMIQATARCNLIEVPTDVCARDERLGWGAEGHFFMRTASYLMDAAPFLRKWSRDIADGQLEDGGFWAIAPAIYMKDVEQFAGDLQSDMGIHVPWTAWRMYGDLETARSRYDGMKRYFDFLERNSDRWVRYAIAGDWLSLLEGGHSDYVHGFGDCPRDILGTAYFACSARMMADLAAALGHADDRDRYESSFARIKQAFCRSFLGRDLRIKDGTQTAYVLALSFGLLPDDAAKVAERELVRDIESRGRPALSCGTAGAPFALGALDSIGRDDLAAGVAASEEYPGLGYMARMGATTVWERWDGIREGRSFHPHAMNAFCHIGFATLGEWMVSGLAGIRCLEPGFSLFSIDPGVSRAVRRARARYGSVRGPIAVEWEWRDDGGFRLECEIPPNSRAVVRMPSNDADVEMVAADAAMPVPEWSRSGNGRFEASLGSGRFALRSRYSE